MRTWISDGMAEKDRESEPSAAQERIAREIIDSAFCVHRALGPGLLESVYEHCLAHELETRGFAVRRQMAVPVVYRDVQIDAGFRMDLLVEQTIIIEVKATEKIIPIHEAQLLTYLKLTGKQLGFILNFNVPRIKDGIRRMVLSS
jgi:GxxExxY protein